MRYVLRRIYRSYVSSFQQPMYVEVGVTYWVCLDMSPLRLVGLRGSPGAGVVHSLSRYVCTSACHMRLRGAGLRYES